MATIKIHTLETKKKKKKKGRKALYAVLSEDMAVSEPAKGLMVLVSMAW